MDIQAKTRFVRLSPSKARDLARSLRGRSVPDALALMEASPRKAAFYLRKTLKSAIANAENNARLSAEKLTVKEAVVEEGPQMKRHWPRSRGMARPIVRRMSHIRIILTDGKSAVT